jgi:RecJ-like exonuclease
LVNARRYGLDGSREACGASVAYAFARAMDAANTDLAEPAIAGIIGDKQRFEGFNRTVLDDAISGGTVVEREACIFAGMRLKEVIEQSIEPYFTHLAHAGPFLEELGLAPETMFDDLAPEEERKMLSALTVKLVEQGVRDVVWYRTTYEGARHGSLADLSSKLNACARFNAAGLGVALCLGDASARKQAERLQEHYRDEIRKELRLLEETEPSETATFLYFYVDRPSLSGVLAGLSLAYLPQFNTGKPVFALARSGNDGIDISSRATERMVADGLNLGDALQRAAGRVGGMGGGHPIAAGGKIPREREAEFLKMLTEELTR